jgi:hypothetical protein
MRLKNMNSFATLISSCDHQFHTACLSKAFVAEEDGSGNPRMNRCPVCRGAVQEVFTGSTNRKRNQWARVQTGLSGFLRRIIFNRYTEVGEEEEVSDED